MPQAITPLKDAVALCDTIIRRHRNPLDLPPAGRWHYHQGVFLLGVLRLGTYLESEEYIGYVRRWLEGLVGEDGRIDYAVGELDALQAGNLLFGFLEDDPDQRFIRGLDRLVHVLDDYPRTDQGGYWHKQKYPDQQWLDGLYMIGPLCAHYARITGRPGLMEEMVRQAQLIEEGAKDGSTGLLRHGFDRSGRAEWARGVVGGQAPEVWGRALGWFPAALLDMMDWMPDDHSGKKVLESMFQRLMPAILDRRDGESGLWFQVLDRGEDPDNWIETSCSSLFLYALAKGIRKGLLDPGLDGIARETYRELAGRAKRDSNGAFTMPDICIGTGIGDYDFYIARPRSENDLHGAGAYLMAALEVERLLQIENR